MPAEQPFSESFSAGVRELEEAIEAYKGVQDSEQYRAQTLYLERLTHDFIAGVRVARFTFTRYPDGHNWVLQTFIGDFLESALSVKALATEGIFNSCRRELRYMIEAAVKYVYIDQQFPGNAPVLDRLALLDNTSKLPRSSVASMDQLTLRNLTDKEALRNAVHSAFGALSGYTHLSRIQLNERMRRAERGEYTGFESAKTLEAFNRVAFQVYDVVLALIFEGIGPSFTGDLFIQVLDSRPEWRYHKGRFVAEVSRGFDYKEERQLGKQGGATI